MRRWEQVKRYRLRGMINLTTVIADSDIPEWEKTSEEKRKSFLEDLKLQLTNLNKHEVAGHGEIHVDVWMEEYEDDNDSTQPSAD
jgi:hypothetical protein